MTKQNNNLQKERLVKNELLIREQNVSKGKGIKKYFRGDTEVRQAPIAFICECSDLECDEIVNMSIDAYEKLHERHDRFVIFPGHETLTIEDTVAQQDGFDIVEKFSVQP